jgi:hypothetical protein
LCTIKDFVELVDDIGAHIERGVALDRAGAPIKSAAPWNVSSRASWRMWNLLGAQAVFLLDRGRPGSD